VHHHTKLSGYIFATKVCIDNRKKVLKSNIFSTCPHNMVNFSPLTAEIVWRVWGTYPTNFNGCRIFASLLHRRRLTEVNQTLHDVWPSRGLLHYVYILGALALIRNSARCNIHIATKSCVLLYWQRYCMHNTRAVVFVSQTLRRVTRKGMRELLFLVCATFIPQGDYHAGHRPTF